MKWFLTFITAVILISLVSLASTVKVLLKLPENNSTFLEVGETDIVIGTDWLLTIFKNKEVGIADNNTHWNHWNNVESFEFQFITGINSEWTNLRKLVDPDGSWIRVKNFKITKKGEDTLQATVSCAEDILVRKAIDNDSTVYGIGSIQFVELSKWTLLIKFTQGIKNMAGHEGNANGSVMVVNVDQRCWLEGDNKELKFTLDVNSNFINSSESGATTYWLGANSIANGKFTGSTGVKIDVAIDRQISLIKKNMLIDKTFKGYLTSSQSILVLVLSNKSEIDELQNAYKHTTLPVLQLAAETPSSSAPKKDVVLDFKSQHKTVFGETLILVFNYWSATSDGKSRMSESRCYLAYIKTFVPVAIAKIMWDQSTSTGSIWITKVWDKNSQKYTVPQSSTLLDEIKGKTLFNVAIRTAADGKAASLSFNHKQWSTVQCLTSKHNSFSGQQNIIDINFGVKISLEVDTGNLTHVGTGFYDLSNQLLTLTTKNEIQVFDIFWENITIPKLQKPLLVRYKALPETTVNEASQKKIYVVEAYSFVEKTKTVYDGEIRQYLWVFNT